MSLEKSTNKTASTESRKGFAREILFNSINLLLAFVAFFRYVHFYLLSASSIESIVFE
jgi:hypothetical protein